MKRGYLHVIRTDVLLWSLGAFSEPPEKAPFARSIEPKLLYRLRQIASKPRAGHGELVDLASKFDQSARCLSVFIWQIRNGIEPNYWASAKGFVRPVRHSHASRLRGWVPLDQFVWKDNPDQQVGS